MNGKHIFLSLIVFMQAVYAHGDKQEMLNRLCSYQGPRTYLLSYPRSGNTWIRYCLEYLTRRPTLTYKVRFNDFMNQPLAWCAEFDLDLNQPPIEKVHTRLEMERGGVIDPDHEYLIVVVRNPKEAITRHEGKVPDKQTLQGVSSDPFYTALHYFDNLAIYDSWNPAKRFMVYYEDLIRMPYDVLSGLVDFLGVSGEHIPSFFADFQKHKQTALSLYAASVSGGNDISFHSKSIPANDRAQIDEWIQELYPAIWHRYLKHRYAEAVLEAQGAYGT